MRPDALSGLIWIPMFAKAFSSSDDFIQKKLFFRKNLPAYKHHQSVKEFGSGLIWVPTVCKGYQQTTLVDKELILYLGS